MDAFWTRFLPVYDQMLDLVERIKPIHFLQADFGFLAEKDLSARTFNPDLGGGTLLDIGIYPVFMALLVLGYPDTIKAQAIKNETGVDETLSIIFSYKHAIASLSSTFMAESRKEGEIAGQGGRILLKPRAHRPDVMEFYPTGGKKETYHFEYAGFGYEYEAMELMDCLDKELLESPKLNHAFTGQLMELLDRIRSIIGLRYAEKIEKL
jgi:predicted dehydrogenase